MKFIRQTLLFLGFLFISKAAFSQTEKGSWMLGGDLGINSGRNTSYDNFNIFVNPQAGFFVLNNLAIGTGIDLTYGQQISSVSGNSYTYHLTTFGLSPFARYYFGKQKFRPFVQAIYNYSHFQESTLPTNSSEVSNSGYTAYATLGGGASYFIAPNVSIDATFDYQVYRSSQNYLFNNQPAFRVGLQVFLPKKTVSKQGD